MCSAYRLRKDIHEPILNSEGIITSPKLLSTSRLASSRRITISTSRLPTTSQDDSTVLLLCQQPQCYGIQLQLQLEAKG